MAAPHQCHLGFKRLVSLRKRVYDNGATFEPAVSDIDLVAIFPSSLQNATDRFKWLRSISTQKVELELELVKLLKRRDTTTPIVSLLPVSRLEIEADIHKSRVRPSSGPVSSCHCRLLLNTAGYREQGKHLLMRISGVTRWNSVKKSGINFWLFPQ